MQALALYGIIVALYPNNPEASGLGTLHSLAYKLATSEITHQNRVTKPI
jgi:hypothetical protein